MKLLFDQNISSRIVRLLKDDFLGCTQVKFAGLNNASDMAIWEWARQNSCCVVSFDFDFLDILTINGFPPKLILLRVGNRKTRDLAEMLVARRQVIDEFLNHDSIGCLEIKQ